MVRAWLVRLGKYGEQEAHALEKGELVTGWQLADISGAGRDDILAKLTAVEPDKKPGTLQNWAVQLNQFVNGMADGDLVVVPLKSTSQLAIGRLAGGYRHTADGHPPVELNGSRETFRGRLLSRTCSTASEPLKPFAK